MSKFNFPKAMAATGTYIKENKKPLLYIGGALVVVVVGIAATKGLKNTFSNILNPFGKAKGKSDFEGLPLDITKATITEAQAKAFANQLFAAMKDSGTTESTIKAVMNKVKNGDDFKLIYNAFGEKSYYVNGEPTISSVIFGWSDLDLMGWFRKELNKWTDYITYNLVKEKAALAGLAF